MIHGIDTSFLVAVELASHPRHADTSQTRQSLNQSGDQFALTPFVLAEFVHIVTDQRRCTNPLTMDVVVTRAEQPRNAAETVQLFPAALRAFFE